MPFYHRQGDLPQKKHVAFYKSDKTLHREELFSTRGFSGIYSTRYRLDMPTKVLSISQNEAQQKFNAWEDSPLMWHMFHSQNFEHPQGDLHQAEQLWMHNAHCQISTSTPKKDSQHFHKNAHQHALVYIHRGSGVFLSEFGNIDFIEGDYINIPKGCIYQFQFNSQDNRCFMVYASSPFDIPQHYRNELGQLQEDAPYSERDFKLPALQEPVDQKGSFTVDIACMLHGKRSLSKHIWDHHPFDVAAWDGYEFPYAFNIKDYAPKVGALHLPPPVHLVFSTQHFVVCNFVPRLFDFYPNAIPAPYFHSNVDSDEVIYYVDGDFMSRKGIEPGSISYHPMGIAHGPQPGKTEKSIGKKETHEYAVMVDTFEPLMLSQDIQSVCNPNYWRSWNEE